MPSTDFQASTVKVGVGVMILNVFDVDCVLLGRDQEGLGEV